MPEQDDLSDLELISEEDVSEEIAHRELVSWIMERANRWRTYRDNAWKEKYGEYYRLWRGKFTDIDRNRNSERSRLIAPALAQALEMTVSEMEEATFGREQWFDISDSYDASPEEKARAVDIRDKLLHDTNRDNLPDCVAATYLNGGLYGNGIAKIVVDTHIQKSPSGTDPVTGKVIIKSEKVVRVKAVPLPADEFIPDPSATTIDEMLGCIHEVNKPLTYVNSMQQKGMFYAIERTNAKEGVDSEMKAEREDYESPQSRSDSVTLAEYHGLVPYRLLPKKDPNGVLVEGEYIESEGEELVEAIVTVGDGLDLYRAIKNPFWMNDRSIVGYQHEKVPGRWHGRGVMEKGYNPQKALDMELRARADAMALISNPMMSADITALPRGFSLKVRPGKLWLTNGDPERVLRPVAFQGLDPSSFNQTGEMERMVQMGTGAMDTATPIKANERNSTATGTSVQMASFVKRSKRAMANVERNFLQPLIKKILWRYMQYDPARYPTDIDLRVSGTLGIVARELETNQMTQLLSLTEQGSAPHNIITKSVFEASASPYKNEMNKAIAEMLAPPSEEEQQLQQLQQQLAIATAQAEAQQVQLENSKLQTEAMLNIAKIQEMAEKGQLSQAELQIELARVQQQFQELQQLARQNDAALINATANLRKAADGGKNAANTGSDT